MFITFEGIEGSGKTTQVRRLESFLTGLGYQCLLTREPGGTTIGEKIRRILLDPTNDTICPRAELLLYVADRTQHVLWRLQNGNLDGISPEVAVVMIGTNNSGDDSPEDIAKGVKAIVDTIEEKCPTARILILGIFPRGKDDKDRRRIVNMKANKIISTFADNRTIFYLDISDAFLDENRVLSRDIMPDLLHPNTKGYEIWAKAMDAKLKELMEDS
jgi:hypothetical protein